ncbi:lysozyme [Dyadobacter psychrotolerans]|uniref:Lysozyme n=1 Tax=Dyadobacter psychrotolerans TaxID=2541721 RepID=A0A4R5DVM8_9BACT|nr:lysozyme [Dyadobacter psychrotolerans]TDE15295.1 lysozyme [Dyadobacter psychrotolerans]
MANMQFSSSGVQVLKNREKLRLKAYPDSNGTLTIGWGFTYYEDGSRVKSGQTITQDRAVQLLNYHIGIAVNGVNKNITASLLQGQFDACVSFVYNAGTTAFANSGLRKLINANPNNTEAIFAEWRKWKYETVNGVKRISDGLIKRREEEIRMYSSGAVAGSSFFFWIVLVVAIVFYLRRKKNKK